MFSLKLFLEQKKILRINCAPTGACPIASKFALMFLQTRKDQWKCQVWLRKMIVKRFWFLIKKSLQKYDFFFFSILYSILYLVPITCMTLDRHFRSNFGWGLLGRLWISQIGATISMELDHLFGRSRRLHWHVAGAFGPQLNTGWYGKFFHIKDVFLDIYWIEHV